jgi:hypothetical protein
MADSDRRGALHVRLAERRCNTKIDELGEPIRGHEHIGWLDIAVDDEQGMGR